MRIFNIVSYYTYSFSKLLVVLAGMLFLVIVFSGCTETINRETYIPVVDTVEVAKPVPCKVEGLYCTFEGEGYMPTYNLLKCLIIHKRIIEICSGKNSEVPFNSSTETIKNYLDKEADNIDLQMVK